MKLKPNQLIEQITYSIITALEETLLEDDTRLNWSRILKVDQMPVNYETKNTYSGINIFQLWNKKFAQSYRSNKWVTYKQAQKLELNLKPEQKGTPIIRYGTYEKERLDSKGQCKINPETGEKETLTTGFLKIFYVFNLSQMENCPEEENQIPEKLEDGQLFFDDQLAEAKKIFDYSGAKISLGYNRAFYSPEHDHILMPGMKQFEHQHDFYSIYFHELTHWSGAKKRLSRHMQYHLDRGKAFEEMIADFGSAFLSAHTGIYNTYLRKSHASYINHWLEVLKKDRSYILSAASQASKAFEFILNEVEHNVTVAKDDQLLIQHAALLPANTCLNQHQENIG